MFVDYSLICSGHSIHQSTYVCARWTNGGSVSVAWAFIRWGNWVKKLLISGRNMHAAQNNCYVNKQEMFFSLKNSIIVQCVKYSGNGRGREREKRSNGKNMASRITFGVCVFVCWSIIQCDIMQNIAR